MELSGKRYIKYGSRSDWITIWGVNDIHWGNRGCAVEKIKADVKRIAEDPYSFWVGLGDYIDAIGYDDKRFDPDCVSEHIKVSDLNRLGIVLMQQVRDLLLPIKDKCLGLVTGNHEKKYEVAKEQGDLHAWLCQELGVANLGYSAMFDGCFTRTPKTKLPQLIQSNNRMSSTSFRFWVHHGAGAAQTEGGKLNKLIKFMERFEADIYMMGHVHDQTGKRIVKLGANANCSEFVEHNKIGIISGAYLRTYGQGVTGYGEQKGYVPTPLGMRSVTIKPDTREVRGEI